MKINKLKKSALKNDKIILGSYHKKIKIASIKKNKVFILACQVKKLDSYTNPKNPVFIGNFQKSPCLSHFSHCFTTLKR
jgi:hypothetical protein